MFPPGSNRGRVYGVPATPVLFALANAQAVATGGVIERYEDRHVNKVSKFRAGRAHPIDHDHWGGLALDHLRCQPRPSLPVERPPAGPLRSAAQSLPPAACQTPSSVAQPD